MKNISEIRQRYPKAFKEKPKGWKFIVNKSLICEGDMIWTYGEGPFIPVYKAMVGKCANGYSPVIRKIQEKTKPAITTLPEVLKASLPKGYVYLGKGGEFKAPKEKCICTFTHCGDYQSSLKWGDCWEREMFSSPESYYAFPINSEIARLNGVKPPNNNFLIKENARLQKELDELKRKIAAFIAEVK